MATRYRDLESQYDGIDLDYDREESSGSRERSQRTRGRTMTQPVPMIELDDVPPIIKSANGNIFWADEQCTRRVGLTSTEARLFLKLLQTDRPENLNYDEYKAMFDDFGREQQRLEELVNALPWYEISTWRQRAIWQARIQWLQRMREPRLWLLYLMARRKRILKTAAMRIMERLREKRTVRVENERRGRNPTPVHRGNMVNSAVQTSIDMTVSKPEAEVNTTVTSVPESQSTESPYNLAARIRDSLSLSPLGKRSPHSRSQSSNARCPVFSDRWEATRGDIKKQVQSIMGEHRPYIVIGWFLQSALHPQEKLLQYEKQEDLFVAIRRGERSLRGWKRFLSLKGLRGFGLYKCDISRGAHLPLLLTPSQSSVLAQLFLAYRASLYHADPDVALAWQRWVQCNLNGDKSNPLEGRYSLLLEYKWSSYRIMWVVMWSLVGSLVVGFWYMYVKGDTATAWNLAMYVVAGASMVIALLGIVGGLGDL